MRKYLSLIFIAFGAFAAVPVEAQQPTPTLAGPIAALARPELHGETRALLIWRNGALASESYGAGYTAETRFVSWSVAKTVTAIALGMLIDEGKLNLDQPAPIAIWRTAADGREAISIRHLLTMTAGLKHQEGGEGPEAIERADTVRLLFSDGAQDAATYAVTRPLVHMPGTHWQYSTATSHVLAEIITATITPSRDPADRRRVMAQWFQQRLWTPLGITSAEWDFDGAGLFLGGSMLHMTAGDYGRLGQFMLARGVSPSGQRLLSEAVFGELLRKANATNNNHYAGHLWLNTGPSGQQPRVLFHPRGGADTFAFVGHLGQYVIVAPSRQMVIVRLGKSTRPQRELLMDAVGAFIDGTK